MSKHEATTEQLAHEAEAQPQKELRDEELSRLSLDKARLLSDKIDASTTPLESVTLGFDFLDAIIEGIRYHMPQTVRLVKMRLEGVYGENNPMPKEKANRYLAMLAKSELALSNLSDEMMAALDLSSAEFIGHAEEQIVAASLPDADDKA